MVGGDRKKLLNLCILGSIFWSVAITQRLCSDGPPNTVDPSECCTSLPNVIDIRLNESCISKYARNTQRQLQNLQPGDSPKGNCVMECIANQTKIYKGYGFFDAITLKRLFMNSVSGNREWSDIVVRSVDLCVGETRVIYRDPKFNGPSRSTSFAGEIICHPISGYIFGCLQTELFRSCPNMTESKECEALQQYASECHIGVKY